MMGVYWVCHSVCNMLKYSAKTPTCIYILGPGKILSRSSYVCPSVRLSVESTIEVAPNELGKRNLAGIFLLYKVCLVLKMSKIDFSYGPKTHKNPPFWSTLAHNVINMKRRKLQ